MTQALEWNYPLKFELSSAIFSVSSSNRELSWLLNLLSHSYLFFWLICKHLYLVCLQCVRRMLVFYHRWWARKVAKVKTQKWWCRTVWAKKLRSHTVKACRRFIFFSRSSLSHQCIFFLSLLLKYLALFLEYVSAWIQFIAAWLIATGIIAGLHAQRISFADGWYPLARFILSDRSGYFILFIPIEPAFLAGMQTRVARSFSSWQLLLFT